MCALGRSRLSYNTVSHGHEQGPGPRWYPPVLPFRYNPCTGTIGSPDSLPVGTPVGSGSYHQVQTGGITLDGTLEMVRQRHQWNELKRNIPRITRVVPRHQRNELKRKILVSP